MKTEQSSRFSAQQTKRRIEAILRGAFMAPATPLKDIPKKSGESRSVKRRKVALSTRGGTNAERDRKP